MNDSITCPHCKKDIPLTEAITHQIDDKYKRQFEEMKRQAEKEKQEMREKAKKWKEEELKKAQKEAEVAAREKVKKELELELKDKENASKELEEKNEKLQDQLLEMNKAIREMKQESKEKELELMKKYDKEQEQKLRDEQRRLEEEYQLKLREKDKQLDDTKKALEDAKRKADQKSQQLQGEVLELSIEETLKREFPLDKIEPIAKGATGADILQHVRTANGKHAGKIVWEMKRTKNWSNSWISKMKSDQRKVSAEIAVLISLRLPDGIDCFGEVDGIWVCGFDYVVPIAHILRLQLEKIFLVHASQRGREDKKEVLYRYINSIEFDHRMRSILESYNDMREEVEKERRWFTKKWAREEANLRKMIDNTVGLQGEIESMTGKSLEAGDVIEDEQIEAELIEESEEVRLL